MERRAGTTVLSAQIGFSLVEMLVAILLTAIIVTATFSALLLTRANLGTSDVQLVANEGQRKLLEALKNYQASSITGLDINSGPNHNFSAASGCPSYSWCLPNSVGTSCSGPNCPAACASGKSCPADHYAFDTTCGHNATSWLQQSLQNAPYYGVMCYTVTDQSGLNGADQSQFRPQVNVFVQFTKETP